MNRPQLLGYSFFSDQPALVRAERADYFDRVDCVLMKRTNLGNMDRKRREGWRGAREGRKKENGERPRNNSFPLTHSANPPGVPVSPPFRPCFTKGTTHALPISVISALFRAVNNPLIKRKSDKLHLSARLLYRVYPRRRRGKATSTEQRREADI